MSNEDIQRDLGRLEGKVDMILDAVKGQNEVVGDIDKRVSDLESYKWYGLGFAATLGWLLTSLVDVKALLAKAL